MTEEKKRALVRARQKRCYERHKSERIAYQKNYYEQQKETIVLKAKLRRIYGDKWQEHYDFTQQNAKGEMRMAEIENKWPGWLIITNENVSCVKCGKRMTEGMLAHCNSKETEKICEVCYGSLRDAAEKKGSL